jgi:hypothetical protein
MGVRGSFPSTGVLMNPAADNPAVPLGAVIISKARQFHNLTDH